MGGSIAYMYAAVHPQDVRRLVIEDAAPRPVDDVRPPIQPLPEAPVFASRDEVVASVRAAQPLMTQEALEQRVDVYYIERPDGTWSFRADVRSGSDRHRATAEIRLALGSRAQHQVPDAGAPGGPGTRGHFREDHRPVARSEPASGSGNGARGRHNIHFAHFAAFMPLLEQFLAEPASVS